MINELSTTDDEIVKHTIVREEALKRKARVNQLRMKTRIRRRKLGAIHKSLK